MVEGFQNVDQQEPTLQTFGRDELPISKHKHNFTNISEEPADVECDDDNDLNNDNKESDDDNTDEKKHLPHEYASVVQQLHSSSIQTRVSKL